MSEILSFDKIIDQIRRRDPGHHEATDTHQEYIDPKQVLIEQIRNKLFVVKTNRAFHLEGLEEFPITKDQWEAFTQELTDWAKEAGLSWEQLPEDIRKSITEIGDHL